MEELRELTEVVEKTQATKEEVERAIAALDNLFTQNEAVLDDRTGVEMIDLRAKLVKKLQAESQATNVAQNKTDKAKPARRRVIPIKEGEPDKRKRRKKAIAFRRDRARKPKEDSSGSLIATVGVGAVLGLLLLLGSGDN